MRRRRREGERGGRRRSGREGKEREGGGEGERGAGKEMKVGGGVKRESNPLRESEHTHRKRQS